MFLFSTITLLNSLTDKSGLSLFNKEDDTLLFKGEGLYQVDEDHLIEMFKNEGHKEYRDIVDITNLEEMISDPTKIYRIEFYIESNANADPLFSNSLSRKSKTVFVEFNSIDSFYVNLNRFLTMTYGSQLLNLVGELDGEIADGKSTVTSANKTNQNNYLMASNCYIRVMNADVLQADDNGKFYSIGKLDIYHGSEGLGTQEDILKNYILPTGYNNRLSLILTTDLPLNGALYDLFIIRYFVNRGNLGIHAVGLLTITETLHCFWINLNESLEFELTINNLIESGNKEKEPPTFMGLYVDNNNNLNIVNYKLGDPVMVDSNDGTLPVYLFVTDEEKNKFTNLYVTNEYDKETTADLTLVFQKIDENIAQDFNENGLENAELYIGLNLCTIPSLAYGIYSNQIKSAKYTYDGVEYDLTYLSTLITATFNVTSDSKGTLLYYYFYNEEADEEYWIRGVDMFDKVEIDETDVSVTSLDEAQGMYQLNVGEHSVKYKLKDPTSISRKSFQYCSSITNVTIPNSVTSIGDEAFRGCSSLTNVIIPDSVISIGESAFYGCSSLSNITIPDNVTSISYGTFLSCSSLTSVTIPNSVTSIGSSSFDGCTSLSSINIPSSVTIIGESAFGGCTSLTTVTMPDSVTFIGGYAFGDCTSLTSITCHSSMPPTLESGAFNITNDCPIYVPAESAETYKAASGWISYAYRIQAIKTPYQGFCKLTLNDGSVVELEGSGELTSAMINSYKSTVTSAEIGELCTSIGDYAFNKFNSLTSVTIPSSVTRIGQNSFQDCTSLSSITIPDSVTGISGSAFNGCLWLTNVTIGSGITYISQLAFSDCRNLKSITLPNSIRSIGLEVFYRCTDLTSVTIEATTPPTLGSDAFKSTKTDLKIYVPSGSVDAYKAKSGWSTYASKIQAILE